MKRILLILLFIPFLKSVYGQSAIKIRSNFFRFNSEYPTKFKTGFGIGYEKTTLSRKWVQLIWAQSLDYKWTNTNYETGGLGYGTKNITANIHFLNAQLDTKLRFGKNLFFDIGGFVSFSIFKKITPSEFADYKNNFESFDGGIITGIGYSLKNIILSLDGQMGLFQLLQSNGTTYKSQQLNLNLSIPFEKFKLKK